MAPMPGSASARDVISNLLESGDLSFRDFMEVALYHPQSGYYACGTNPVGQEGDYVTSPLLSPVFAFSLGKLISEFVSRCGYAMSTVVDIGCGDGQLIHSLYENAGEATRTRCRFFGVDRCLERIVAAARSNAALTFVRSLSEVPKHDAQLLISNELFDSFPFARLVQRDEHLHELWVSEHDGELEWSEREANSEYEDYFGERGVELAEGQFADISLDWGPYYREMSESVEHGMIVTFDYGFRREQLFHPRFRRFGTAAAYSRQRVTRDLLSDPGTHDITAHINFSDLIRAGELAGMKTLFFDRQAKFLLALGAAEHELLAPVEEVASLEAAVDLRQRREDARRLVLPDGIGEDIRALVQSRGIPDTGWSFQRKLW
jgi:SAM-dependent MidA family methyltransferase